MKKAISKTKQQALQQFKDHVSSAKADFFSQLGMDMVMGKREGATLWDLDDQKRLFNLHCNGGVFNLGHRNAELRELLIQSLDTYDIGNHHLMSYVRAELAAILAATMPADLDYTVFAAGGGEAVDLAIKVARAWTKRSKIVSAKGGYHGHTGLAVATGDPKYRQPFGISADEFVQAPFGDLASLETAMEDDTAAVILETIPATIGIVIPPAAYLNAVRELCDQKGSLLILDEVQTGLGRTGKLWGFEHFDVVPDMVVLGKGLSGGLYPIAATVLRTPLEQVFHADPFIHISTFGGAELGCCIAKRVVEISADPVFLERVNNLAQTFARYVDALRNKFPDFLIGFRQLGLMMGLVFAGDFSGPMVTKTAYDNDLLMIYANNDTRVCQLLPPLIMEPEQVPWIMARLEKAIGSAYEQLGGTN
ncbi:MAG: aminotransferase class III-fold pyridoxal phosphate-dependent enzyme [Deltaproteobacteria bacterium]|nr:aminotransferase class III-fold pyridoxal phosphate-dependent enzyme [Deltaproteobacteria bacterium]